MLTPPKTEQVVHNHGCRRRCEQWRLCRTLSRCELSLARCGRTRGPGTGVLPRAAAWTLQQKSRLGNQCIYVRCFRGQDSSVVIKVGVEEMILFDRAA